MRYVVIVKVEDAIRVYGSYQDRARAGLFADAVNAKIDREEEKEFTAWQKRNEPDEMAPDPPGRAYVLLVHQPRVREGVHFGLTGSNL